MAVATGLYQHIEDSRRRSLLLFLLFAVAFQLLAAIVLCIPLLLFDPAHAPVFAGLGYVTRYVPLVALLSLLLFAAQMWWFVGGVRQATQFRYVDDREEPRFCHILEPLAIAAGIPIPFAGVIETTSLNAFAAGVHDRHMVVVATRGLLDALDDDELAGVLANAVIHIRNHDTRLLGAATIFMRNMTVLNREKGLRLYHPLQGIALILLPMMLPVLLAMGLLVQLAFRIGYGSRALIGISRELIADAEGVRLTLNPAALVSALRKIDQRHGIDGLGDEFDAMLIFGVPTGPLASHPTLDERTGALARTMGSLVLDTSQRLDTRAGAALREPPPADAVDPAIERISLLAEAPERRGLWGAFRSARDPDRNILGLDRRGAIILAGAVAGIALVYRPDWTQPRAVAAVFDPTGATALFGTGLRVVKCAFGIHTGPQAGADCDRLIDEAGGLLQRLPGGTGKPAEPSPSEPRAPRRSPRCECSRRGASGRTRR